MKKHEENKIFSGVDSGNISFIPVLDDFYDGVIISDVEGKVVYFNNTQARIDDIDRSYAVGKKVQDLYQLDGGLSPMMTCLRTKKPIENVACFYRTRLGKVVNSIHNVFPLFAEHQLIGAICFIRDYSIIERTFDTVEKGQRLNLETYGPASRPHLKHKQTNGTRFNFADIIGNNPEFLRAVEAARLASQSPSPVMLFGETGTGKELFAQAIHNHSSRKNRRFVAVNCTAIPENLLEGTLFGTSKGAFTGAIDKAGLFELANTGTLFLDEINSMAIGLQAKLLRTLQERKVRRVGALEEKEIDLKIISSINTEPHRAIETGNMRPDLLYRLAVVFIRIPPLRDRMDDLIVLINHFVAKCNQALGKGITDVSPAVLEAFQNYRWPGNTRELEHVIEGAMNLATTRDIIDIPHLSVHVSGFPAEETSSDSGPKTAFNDAKSRMQSIIVSRSPDSLARDKMELKMSELSLPEIHVLHEIESIQSALTAAAGIATQAAKTLGISPQLLTYKMKKYSIDRKRYKKDRAFQ